MSSVIIDNGVNDEGSGYSEPSGSWSSQASGYGGHSRSEAANSGATAKFLISGLSAGVLQQVSLTWVLTPAFTATDVPWTVYDSDGTTVLGSGQLNQQTAPTHFSDGGVSWNALGRFTPTGTLLTVKLSASTVFGNVVADAARADTIGSVPNVYKIKDNTDKISVLGVWPLTNLGEFPIGGIVPDLLPPAFDATNVTPFCVQFLVNMPTGGVVSASTVWTSGGLKVAVDNGSLDSPAANATQGGIAAITGSLSAGEHLIGITTTSAKLLDLVIPADASITSVARTQATFYSNPTGTNMPNVASPLTPSGWYKIGNAASIYLLDTSANHGALIEFASNAHAIDVMNYSGSAFRSGIDGDVSTLTPTNTFAGDQLTTANTGLSGSTQHLTVWPIEFGLRTDTIRLRRGVALAIAASISDTVLHVASSTGYAAGEWVEIGNFPSNVEIAQIASVATGTITLASGLAKAHAVGELISNFKETAATVSSWSKTRTKSILVEGDSRFAAANGSSTPGYINYDPKYCGAWRALAPLDWNILNVAGPGNNAQGCRDTSNQIPDFSHGPHDVYCCLIGVNDHTGNVTLTNYKSFLTTMITNWKAEGGTSKRYILFHDYDANHGANSNGDTIDDFNTAIDEVCAAETTGGYTVEAIDLATGLTFGGGNDVPDNTHPGNSGHNKIAANLLGILYTDRNVWRGTASGAWNTAGNWSLGHVPTNSEEAVFGFAVTLTDTVPSAFAGRMRSIGGAVDLNASTISSATLTPVIDGTFTNYSTVANAGAGMTSLLGKTLSLIG